MQAFKKISLSVIRLSTKSPLFYYPGDPWKERDEAAQKVYITEAEKTTIKKLLKKIEEEQQHQLHNNQRFQAKLRGILKEHQINNDAFFSQVSNLHKTLSRH